MGRLQKQLDANRQDVGTEEDLFKHKPKSSRKLEMQGLNNRQMMVEEGDRGQKESGDALKRIQANIGVMDEQANEILT